jgi:hypothetical protein
MRANPILGFPEPVSGLESDVGLRQAVAGPEAGRAHPVRCDRAQLIEPGAMMGAPSDSSQRRQLAPCFKLTSII